MRDSWFVSREHHSPTRITIHGEKNESTDTIKAASDG